MAIDSYTTLQAAVANWLERGDLSLRIPEFIALAEAQMNRKLRVQRMIQRETASISTTNAFSAVPSNFLRAISFQLTDGSSHWDVEPMNIERISQAQSNGITPATPLYYAINGTSSGREFQFYPSPDKTYTATLTYWGKPTPLSETNASNWILEEAPDLYLYGTLLQAAPYLRDDGAITIWQSGFDAVMNDVMTMDRTQVGSLRTEVAMMQRPQRFNINQG